MFTRRHYEAIAEVLKEYFAEQDYAETHDIRPRPSIEGALATMFDEDDNGNELKRKNYRIQIDTFSGN